VDGKPASIDAREALLTGLRARTLPRAAWTHEAHLAAARAVYRESGDVDLALGELRGLITAYNANTAPPSSGVICHETITRYYLASVIALDALPLTVLLSHPWCSRRAPLRHWSAPVLRSERARHTWVRPDLSPPPWLIPFQPAERTVPVGATCFERGART
jgi:hypothetical protein